MTIAVLENIHIQKWDMLARALSGLPKMYQYILDQKWDVPLRPPKMYQYILCQKVRPPKTYQYILDQK